MIRYLINNNNVLEKAIAGSVCLVNIDPEEKEAILEIFLEEENPSQAYLWK